jgi:hypothetical protein
MTTLRIKRGRLAVATLILLITSAERISVAELPVSEIILCGAVVAPIVQQRNATFHVFYQLDTDVSGKTTRVTKLRNDFLPEGPLVACLQRWRLPVANAKVRVSMRWEHAKGWTQLGIAMPGYQTQLITIQPGWPF